MARVIRQTDRQTDSIAAGTPGLRSCAVSPVDPSFPFHVEDISTRLLHTVRSALWSPAGVKEPQ